MNLRGVNGNIDDEMKKEKKVVELSVDHVNDVKKDVESGRCMGIGVA